MLSLNRISYEIQGRSLFENPSFNFNSEKYGLVGPNGIGKSTLMRIISGLIEPDSGQIISNNRITYFHQIEDAPNVTIGELLIDFWNNSQAELIQKLVGGIPFETSAKNLSGGEWVRVRLARTLIEEPDFIILDEPSNNLDTDGKQALINFIENFAGGLILISHDRALLEKVDNILELSNKGLSLYGGRFSQYWDVRTAERQKLETNLRTAKKDLKKKKAERVEKLDRQTKRMRDGTKRTDSLGLPKIILGGMKRRAQQSLAKLDVQETKITSDADRNTGEKWDDLKIDPFIRFDFSSSRPPEGKVHFSVENVGLEINGFYQWVHAITFSVRGSERWQIKGLNATGKSSLIQALLSIETPGRAFTGHIYRGTGHAACLDQKYGQLKPELSLLDNLVGNSRFNPTELRNELVFFGFAKDSVNQPIKTFSGGELLKASLALILLGRKLPEVLILDEPTNNLDLSSQELLKEALRKFEGSIVVISHDQDFIDGLGVTNEITLVRKN